MKKVLEQKGAKRTQWRPAQERARDPYIPARSKNDFFQIALLPEYRRATRKHENVV